MVDSTKICARLGPTKASRYYQVFINSMAKILAKYEGTVIKNIGDCLLYYFSHTKETNENYFANCLNASIAMIEAHDTICDRLRDEGLPCLDYRISLDYGNVIMMKSNMSSSVDMIGPPLNMSTRINRYAKKNGVVIGGDMYEMSKKLKQIDFKAVTGHCVGFKFSYPVYSVSKTGQS